MLTNFKRPEITYKLTNSLHEMTPPLMKRAGHPKYIGMKLNQLSVSAVNMLMRSTRIFRFISLAKNNASTHSRQNRNGGSTRNVKIEMIAAVLASKNSLRSASLRLNDIGDYRANEIWQISAEIINSSI